MKLTRSQALSELGLDENASEDEIKRAYKKLALQWHPDKNQDKEAATLKFQMISNAYARLSARNHTGDNDDLDDLDPDDIFDEDDFEEFADILHSEFFYRMFFGGMRMRGGGRRGGGGGGGGFHIFFDPATGVFGVPMSGWSRGGPPRRPPPRQAAGQRGARGSSYYTYDSDSDDYDDDDDDDSSGSYSTADEDEAREYWEQQARAKGAQSANARKDERKRRSREADDFFARTEDSRRAAAAAAPDPGLIRFAGQQLPRPANLGGVRSETSIRVTLDPKKKATDWLHKQIIRFELEHKRAGDPPTAPWVLESSDTSATFDVMGLTPGTKYVFRGRAGTWMTGADGTGLQWGKHSEESFLSTTGKAPVAEARAAPGNTGASTSVNPAAAAAPAGPAQSGAAPVAAAGQGSTAPATKRAAGEAPASTAATTAGHAGPSGATGSGSSAAAGAGSEAKGGGQGKKKKGRGGKGSGKGGQGQGDPQATGDGGGEAQQRAAAQQAHAEAEARRQEQARQEEARQQQERQRAAEKRRAEAAAAAEEKRRAEAAAAAVEKRRAEAEKEAAMRAAMEAAAAEYEQSVRKAAAAAAAHVVSGKATGKRGGGGGTGGGVPKQAAADTVPHVASVAPGGVTAPAKVSVAQAPPPPTPAAPVPTATTRQQYRQPPPPAAGPNTKQVQWPPGGAKGPVAQPQRAYNAAGPAGASAAVWTSVGQQGATGGQRGGSLGPRHYGAGEGGSADGPYGRPFGGGGPFAKGPAGSPFGPTGAIGSKGRGGTVSYGEGVGGGRGRGAGGRASGELRVLEDLELELAIAASLKSAQQEGLTDLIDPDALAAINAAANDSAVVDSYASSVGNSRTAAAPPPPPSTLDHFPTLPTTGKPVAPAAPAAVAVALAPAVATLAATAAPKGVAPSIGPNRSGTSGGRAAAGADSSGPASPPLAVNAARVAADHAVAGMSLARTRSQPSLAVPPPMPPPMPPPVPPPLPHQQPRASSATVVGNATVTIPSTKISLSTGGCGDSMPTGQTLPSPPAAAAATTSSTAAAAPATRVYGTPYQVPSGDACSASTGNMMAAGLGNRLPYALPISSFGTVKTLPARGSVDGGLVATALQPEAALGSAPSLPMTSLDAATSTPGTATGAVGSATFPVRPYMPVDVAQRTGGRYSPAVATSLLQPQQPKRSAAAAASAAATTSLTTHNGPEAVTPTTISTVVAGQIAMAVSNAATTALSAPAPSQTASQATSPPGTASSLGRYGYGTGIPVAAASSTGPTAASVTVSGLAVASTSTYFPGCSAAVPPYTTTTMSPSPWITYGSSGSSAPNAMAAPAGPTTASTALAAPDAVADCTTASSPALGLWQQPCTSAQALHQSSADTMGEASSAKPYSSATWAHKPVTASAVAAFDASGSAIGGWYGGERASYVSSGMIGGSAWEGVASAAGGMDGGGGGGNGASTVLRPAVPATANTPYGSSISAPYGRCISTPFDSLSGRTVAVAKPLSASHVTQQQGQQQQHRAPQDHRRQSQQQTQAQVPLQQRNVQQSYTQPYGQQPIPQSYGAQPSYPPPYSQQLYTKQPQQQAYAAQHTQQQQQQSLHLARQQYQQQMQAQTAQTEPLEGLQIATDSALASATPHTRSGKTESGETAAAALPATMTAATGTGPGKRVADGSGWSAPGALSYGMYGSISYMPVASATGGTLPISQSAPGSGNQSAAFAGYQVALGGATGVGMAAVQNAGYGVYQQQDAVRR